MAKQLEKSDPAIYSITSDMPRMDTAIQTLAKRSIFWRPVYLAQSAWLEHVPFAFWLIEAHRPRLFVELGVHYGVSYFAFCQAVDRLGLDTHCFGVDTFKGDEHAGSYGENVFEQVNSHNNLQYSGFSRIVQSTFDEALMHFADGSVDLLHIDGLHTYEAVRHDFESWLPKLSKQAVVIMHDTNVRERNFGVFKLFESLKKRYPHFEFAHGHGLGVLGVGEEQNELMQLLFRASDHEHSRKSVQEVFSRLGQACSSALSASSQREYAKFLSVSIEKQKKQLDEANQSLEKKNADIDNLGKELVTAKETIRTQLQHHEREKEHFLEMANLLQELRNELKDQVTLLQGRIETLSTKLQLKDQELSVFNRERNEYQRQIDLAMANIAERDLSIDSLHKAIEEEKKEKSHASALLIAREAELEEIQSNLQKSCANLEKLREENESKASEIFTLKQTLSSRIEDLNAANQTLSSHIGEINHLNTIIESRNIDLLSLQEKIDQLQSKNEELSQSMQAFIADKDKQTKNLENSARKLADLKKMLEERDTILQEKSREEKAQERRLDDRFKEIAELTRIIEEREQLLNAKDKEIASYQQRSNKLDNELKTKIEAIKAHEQQLAEAKTQASKMQAQKDTALTQLQAEQQKLKNELQEKTEFVRNIEKQLTETKMQAAKMQTQKDAELAQLQAEQQKLQNEIQVQSKRLEDRFQELAALTKLLEERDRALVKKDNELQTEKQRIEKFLNPLIALSSFDGNTSEKTMKVEKRNSLSIREQVSLIEKSGLFDKSWYLSQYPDVAESKMNPVQHYVLHGALEGRMPGPNFDTQRYVKKHPSLLNDHLNPLVHYIKNGMNKNALQ